MPRKRSLSDQDLLDAHWQGTLGVWSFTRDAPLVDVVRTALDDLMRRLRARDGRR